MRWHTIAPCSLSSSHFPHCGQIHPLEVGEGEDEDGDKMELLYDERADKEDGGVEELGDADSYSDNDNDDKDNRSDDWDEDKKEAEEEQEEEGGK
jgi:hypothetical protein